MEDGLVIEDTNNVEHIFLEYEFNKYCPFYLSIGMSYNQYWFDDPTIASFYYKAYIEKEKREAEKTKWIVWEQGLYVYEAICDVAPILQAFSKCKKPLPYPSEPHGLNEFKEKSIIEIEKEKKAQEELDMYRTQIFFENWARNTKKSFKNK